MKKMILYFAALLIVLLSFEACSNMNDLHEEYLLRGEKVYAAKVDSVKTYVGVNKQVLDIYTPQQRIKRGVIKWNLGRDSLEFVLPTPIPDCYRVTIDNLEEGNYTYEIYSYDASGNISIPFEVTSNVVSQQTMDEYKRSLTKSVYYSELDAFKAILKNRLPQASISNAQNFGGNAWFMWDNGALPGAKVIIKYENRENQWVEKVYLGEDIVKGWDNTLTDAIVEPADIHKFTYQTIYENQSFEHTIDTEIDLGEMYADRYFNYTDVIVITEWIYPVIEDIF